jgi:hypothetical protein
MNWWCIKPPGILTFRCCLLATGYLLLIWSNMAKATYDDVNLILRLYDMRREEKLRAARTWFVTNFKPKTFAEMNALCGPGTEANPLFRQAISYWDMVASFVTAGVLNEELFFQSNRELLLFWLRIKPVVNEVRTTLKDPHAWKNLETVGESFAKHLGPEILAAFAARIGA